jgi:hypothetical protein
MRKKGRSQARDMFRVPRFFTAVIESERGFRALVVILLCVLIGVLVTVEANIWIRALFAVVLAGLLTYFVHISTSRVP